MAYNFAHTRRYGISLLLASSVAGLVTAVVAALDVGNGIAYSAGAYLVLISTAFLVVASLVLLSHRKRKWLTVVLAVLTLLDLVGTGFAAYFLETPVLLAFMVLGLLGWSVYLLVDRAHQDISAAAAAGRLA